MAKPYAAAAAALFAFNQRAAERNEELNRFSSVPDLDASDEDGSSDSPVFDSFFAMNGNSSITKMTNLTSAGFANLWTELRECIESKWNHGRGKRSTFSGKDALFMLLTVLKHGSLRDFLALMFKLGSGTFERTMINMLNTVCDYAYDRYVTKVLRKYDIQTNQDGGDVFRNFPTLNMQ